MIKDVHQILTVMSGMDHVRKSFGQSMINTA